MWYTGFSTAIISSRAQCRHNFPRLYNYLWVRWQTHHKSLRNKCFNQVDSATEICTNLFLIQVSQLHMRPVGAEQLQWRKRGVHTYGPIFKVYHSGGILDICVLKTILTHQSKGMYRYQSIQIRGFFGCCFYFPCFAALCPRFKVIRVQQKKLTLNVEKLQIRSNWNWNWIKTDHFSL